MSEVANSVTVAATAADTTVHNAACVLYGFTLREAAGTPAAAKCQLRDGSGGTVLAVVNLNAEESTRENWPTGIRVHSGVYLDMGSGTVEGSIFVG